MDRFGTHKSKGKGTPDLQYKAPTKKQKYRPRLGFLFGEGAFYTTFKITTAPGFLTFW